MTLIDIGIVFTLLYNALIGAKRGLIRIAFDFLAMFGGISVATFLYKDLAKFILHMFHIKPLLAYALGFIIVWVFCFIIFSVFGSIVHKLVKLAFLGPANLFGGLIFGLAKGFVFLLPFLIPMTLLNFKPLNEAMIGSKLKPAVVWIADNLLPDNIMKKIDLSPNALLKKIEQQIDDRFDLKQIDLSKLGTGSEKQLQRIDKLIKSGDIKKANEILKKLSE